jgi:hypothetical protein
MKEPRSIFFRCDYCKLGSDEPRMGNALRKLMPCRGEVVFALESVEEQQWQHNQMRSKSTSTNTITSTSPNTPLGP